MQKTRLLDRFTATGRVRRRLAAIRSRVRSGDLGWREAGDLVALEVLEPAAALPPREAHALSFQAELLRAALYLECPEGGAVDAAQALASAHAHLLACDGETAQPLRLIDPALAVIRKLARLRSRRTILETARICLSAAHLAGVRDERVRRLLRLVPRLLTRALPRGSEAAVALVQEAARHFTTGGADLQVTRRRLFEHAVRGGAPQAAVILLREEDRPSLALQGRLLRALLDGGEIRPGTVSFVRRLTETCPIVLEENEELLLRAAEPAEGERDGPLPDRRAEVNALMLEALPHLPEPCIHLARSALWEERDAFVLGHVLAGWERGWRPRREDETILVWLHLLGFRRLVAALEASAEEDLDLLLLVHRAEKALEEEAAEEAASCEGSLRQALSGRHLPPRLAAALHRLRGRLIATAGDKERMLHFCAQVLSRDPTCRESRLALASAWVHAPESRAKCLAIVDGLLSEAPSQESLALKAEVLESGGEGKAALSCLRRALEAPNEVALRRRHLASLREEALGMVHLARSALGELLEASRRDARERRVNDASTAELCRRITALSAQVADPAERVEILRPLAAREQASREVRLAAARALLACERFEEAREILSRLLEENRSDHRAQELRGLAALALGRREEALSDLERCWASREAGPGVILALASLRAEEGDVWGALSTLGDLPEDLSSEWIVEWRRLEGALLERLGSLPEALLAYRHASRLTRDAVVRHAHGRLAVSLAFDHEGTSESLSPLLHESLDLLADAEDLEDRLWLEIARLRRGGDPDPKLLEALAAGEEVDPRLEAFFHREFLCAAMRKQDAGLVTLVRDRLRGEGDHEARTAAERHLVFRDLMMMATGATDVDPERTARGLAALPDEAERSLGREIMDNLLGRSPQISERDGVHGPPFLRLAAAWTHLCRGSHPERARRLVEDLASSADAEAAGMARAILALLDPDCVGAEVEEIARLPAARRLLAPRDARSLRARAAWLKAEDPPAEARADATPLLRRIAAAEDLERVLEEVRVGGNPLRAARHLEGLLGRLSEGTVRDLLERSFLRVRAMLEEPSLAALSERISAGEGEAAVALAETLVEAGDDPVARHHLALLRHAEAMTRDRRGETSAPGAFERAHREWEAFFAHPAAFEHLMERYGLDESVWEDAASTLRRSALSLHVVLARDALDGDPERACAHGRLLRHSPLHVPGREELRTLLVQVLTAGLDPMRPADWPRLTRSLDVLLRADAAHPLVLRLLLLTEGARIRELLDGVQCVEDIPRLDEERLAALDDRLARGACAVASVSDAFGETQEDGEREALALGSWYLGEAVTSWLAKGGDRECVLRSEQALSWLEKCNRCPPDLFSLAEELLGAASAPVKTPGRDESTGSAGAAAADPPTAEIAEIEALMREEKWGMAEARLLELSSASLERHGVAGTREIIDLLHRVRTEKEAARMRSMLSALDRMLREGRAAEAMGILNGMGPERIMEPPLLARRIQANVLRGRVREAREDFDVLALSSAPWPEESEVRELVVLASLGERLDPRFRQAQRELFRGRPREALDLLDGLEASQAADPAALALRARILILLGRRAEAAEALKPARISEDGERNPEFASVLDGLENDLEGGEHS